MEFREFAAKARQLSQQPAALQGHTRIRTFEARNDTSFRVLVDTTPGRNHLMLVEEVDAFVLCTALGVKLPKGREVSAEMGMDLLRRNATESFGGWCILDRQEETWIALQDTFMLEPVQAAWACTRLQLLALAADSFEAEELARDDF